MLTNQYQSNWVGDWRCPTGRTDMASEETERDRKMNANDVVQEVAELNGLIDETEDPRECYAAVRDCIRKHREAGDEIPEDLQRLEKVMLTECLAESQGR